MRNIAVNAEGGRQDGSGLATLLKAEKQPLSPIIATISELDGPNQDRHGKPAHDRVVNTLKDKGFDVYWAGLNGTTHGQREVGFAVLGAIKNPVFKVVQVTPNSNADHSQWEGDGMDRHVATLTFERFGKKYGFMSVHAPTNTRTRLGEWTDTQQARDWKKGRAEVIEPILARWKATGRIIEIGGDLNDEADAPGPSGTAAWLGRHGLHTYARSGVGVIASDAKPLGQKAIDLTGKHVSDHRTAVELDVPGLRKPKPAPRPVLKGFMPGAIIENIPPGINDPAILPCGVIEHVAVSNSPDIRPVFTDGRGIESHFYTRFDGTIIQYRSIFFEADANFSGNSFFLNGKRVGFVSVEHEGGVPSGGGTLTAEQLASFKKIVRWVQTQNAFPLRVAPAWNAPGVGYHSLYKEWNPNAHSCPGPQRIAQFKSDIVPWLARGGK